MSWTNLYRQIPAMAKLGYLIKWKLSQLVLKILQRSLHQSPVAFFAEVLPLAVRLPRLWGVCSPGSCSLAVHLGDSRKERQLGDPPAISKRNHEKQKVQQKMFLVFALPRLGHCITIFSVHVKVTWTHGETTDQTEAQHRLFWEVD